LAADLGDQEIDHSFEWIETEGLSDRGAEIRVCVDVIKYEATISSLQVLDPTYVQTAGSHQFFAGLHSCGRNILIRIKFNRLGRFGRRRFALGTAAFGIAYLGRTQIEAAVRNDAHCIKQLSAEKLHSNDALGRIELEIFLQHEQIIRKPQIGLITQETDQIIGCAQQVHASAAPTLLRLEQSRPMISPVSERRIHSVECQCARVQDAQTLHQRGLCGLAELQCKGSGAIEYPRPSKFERPHQGERKWHRSRVSAHVRTWTSLVEVERSFRRAIRIESCPLEVTYPKPDLAALQGRKKWLLPLGVFKQNDKIVTHARVSYYRPQESTRDSKLEGLDPDWVPDGCRRVVNYNPLPHGRYQFRVRAMLPGGVPSDAEFSFEVLPHFYQTGWFYALCMASFLGAVYGIYLLRLRQMRGRFALALDERARLAREIHDTLAQGFVGISSQLEALAIKLNGDLEVARQHLDLARKMARHSLTEARQSVMDLRTSKQEKRDLQEALETSAHRWVAGSSVNLQMDVAGDLQQVPEDVAQNLLRIAQEAVVNVLKHAKARVIWVKLEIQDRVLRLRVRDDGQGFEPSGAFLVADGHFGVLGMRERARYPGRGECSPCSTKQPLSLNMCESAF